MSLQDHPFFSKKPVIPSINDLILMGIIILATLYILPPVINICSDWADKIYPSFHAIHSIILLVLGLSGFRMVFILSSFLNTMFPRTSVPILRLPSDFRENEHQKDKQGN